MSAGEVKQPIEPVAWRRWDKRAYEWETYHGSKPSFPTEPLYTAAALEAAKQEGRRQGLEEAATLVQNYDTHGDHTQGWQDIFAERIRELKDKP